MSQQLCPEPKMAHHTQETICDFVSALTRRIAAGPMLEPLHLQHSQRVSLSAGPSLHKIIVSG